MLEECLAFLESKKSQCSYEVIIVNDGSTDKTASVAMDHVLKYGADKVRLLNLIQNRGKGGAVRLVGWFLVIFVNEGV